MEVKMANEEHSNDFMKGLVIGSVVGGAIGALVALLYAPKPGVEFRKQLVDTTNEVYGKAQDYFSNTTDKIKEQTFNTYNEGKEKAQALVESAKQQAEDLIHKAEDILADAKNKAGQVPSGIKAGVEAFKNEFKSEN
jgi:gas vesicle protein